MCAWQCDHTVCPMHSRAQRSVHAKRRGSRCVRSKHHVARLRLIRWSHDALSLLLVLCVALQCRVYACALCVCHAHHTPPNPPCRHHARRVRSPRSARKPNFQVARSRVPGRVFFETICFSTLLSAQTSGRRACGARGLFYLTKRWGKGGAQSVSAEQGFDPPLCREIVDNGCSNAAKSRI